MLAHEREHGAEHHPVQADHIKGAEAEEEAGAVREQAHHDVVGEDLQRQDG